MRPLPCLAATGGVDAAKLCARKVFAPDGAVSLNFALPRAGAYALAVYDASGRRLAELPGGRAEAGALQHVALPLDAYPPGLYLVRLTTAAGTQRVQVVKQ